MSDVIAPLNTVTFTIRELPRDQKSIKTIDRLMRMQPEVAKVLRSLQARRKRVDNKTYIRAGRPWTNRKKATRVTRPEVGASFTLKLFPHLIPDINSVEKYLDSAKA